MATPADAINMATAAAGNNTSLKVFLFIRLFFTISLLIILKQFERMLRLLILKIFPPIGSNSHLPLALVFPLPLFCQVLGKVKRISRHVPEFHVLGEHLFIGIFFNPNFLFLLLKVKD